MALDVVTLGRVSQKRGNPKVVREAVLMGGPPDYEAPFICRRRYPF